MLLDLVTLRNIADILVRLRLKDARARHDLRLFHSISHGAPSPEELEDSGAGEYLPPRRQWTRPPEEARRRMSPNAVARASVWRAIHAQARGDGLSAVSWGRKLLGLVEGIRETIESVAISTLSPPAIYPIPKPGSPGKFRVIAACAEVRDRVLCGLLARYLEDFIEPLLAPSCYSFRVCGLTHHDAAAALGEYRQRFMRRRLYVAECDIKGFYDGLVHDVAIDAVRSAASDRGIALDPRADKILCDVLSGYSFPGYALPAAAEILAERSSSGSVEWLSPKERARVYGDIPDDRIGIAQGNPTSPILANAVLRQADALSQQCLGENGFYARFCDDVILVHPRKSSVSKALGEYTELLRALRLPTHKPVEVREYSAAYYQLKSKRPYRWGGPSTKPFAIPWVQFVGYQVRFDGTVRIRKESISRQKAEISKLFAMARHVIDRSLRAGVDLKKSGDAIYFTLTARIIRAGTGDRRRNAEPVGGEPCWIDAFPLIEDNQFTRHQLRELDRHRELQFRRFRHWLRKKGLIDGTEGQSKDGEPNTRRYFGAPYSYYGAVGQSNRRYQRASDNYTESRSSVQALVLRDLLKMLDLKGDEEGKAAEVSGPDPANT